jgi:Zn finger protein HypA/HybF involved in hydrogenase expression
MAMTRDDDALRITGPEPYVFECRSCGKVFDARTRRAFCPECDSAEVTRLTD